jgi:hypothetical protein
MANIAKLFAGSVKGFSDRGSRFRRKRALFCEGINCHAPAPMRLS